MYKNEKPKTGYVMQILKGYGDIFLFLAEKAKGDLVIDFQNRLFMKNNNIVCIMQTVTYK